MADVYEIGIRTRTLSQDFEQFESGLETSSSSQNFKLGLQARTLHQNFLAEEIQARRSLRKFLFQDTAALFASNVRPLSEYWQRARLFREWIQRFPSRSSRGPPGRTKTLISSAAYQPAGMWERLSVRESNDSQIVLKLLVAKPLVTKLVVRASAVKRFIAKRFIAKQFGQPDLYGIGVIGHYMVQITSSLQT